MGNGQIEVAWSNTAMLDYTVRRSPRARRASVRVSYEGVEVVLPTRAPLSIAEQLVAEKADWIRSVSGRFEDARSKVSKIEFVDGAKLPLLGGELELWLLGAQKERARIDTSLNALVLHGPDHSRARLAELAERAYKNHAKKIVPQLVHERAAAYGTPVGTVSVRGQTTRWGSCSANGDISINWRLLLAPEAVYRYVIEHELAHLLQPNHSQKFWDLVEQRVPDWRAHRDWLREHGESLRLS